MRQHATHAIATVDVAFDLIDDPEIAADTAVILLARILRAAPADMRQAVGEALTHRAVLLLEHVRGA